MKYLSPLLPPKKHQSAYYHPLFGDDKHHKKMSKPLIRFSRKNEDDANIDEIIKERPRSLKHLSIDYKTVYQLDKLQKTIMNFKHYEPVTTLDFQFEILFLRPLFMQRVIESLKHLKKSLCPIHFQAKHLVMFPSNQRRNFLKDIKEINRRLLGNEIHLSAETNFFLDGDKVLDLLEMFSHFKRLTSVSLSFVGFNIDNIQRCIPILKKCKALSNLHLTLVYGINFTTFQSFLLSLKEIKSLKNFKINFIHCGRDVYMRLYRFRPALKELSQGCNIELVFENLGRKNRGNQSFSMSLQSQNPLKKIKIKTFYGLHEIRIFLVVFVIFMALLLNIRYSLRLFFELLS